MSDQQNSKFVFVGRFAQISDDLFLHRRVEARGGLIRDQHFGFGGKDANKRQTLGFAPTDLVWAPVEKISSQAKTLHQSGYLAEHSLPVRKAAQILKALP